MLGPKRSHGPIYRSMAMAFPGASRYNGVPEPAGRDLETPKSQTCDEAWSHRVITGCFVSQKSGIDRTVPAIGVGGIKRPEHHWN